MKIKVFFQIDESKDHHLFSCSRLLNSRDHLDLASTFSLDNFASFFSNVGGSGGGSNENKKIYIYIYIFQKINTHTNIKRKKIAPEDGDDGRLWGMAFDSWIWRPPRIQVINVKLVNLFQVFF